MMGEMQPLPDVAVCLLTALHQVGTGPAGWGCWGAPGMHHPCKFGGHQHKRHKFGAIHTYTQTNMNNGELQQRPPLATGRVGAAWCTRCSREPAVPHAQRMQKIILHADSKQPGNQQECSHAASPGQECHREPAPVVKHNTRNHTLHTRPPTHTDPPPHSTSQDPTSTTLRNYRSVPPAPLPNTHPPNKHPPTHTRTHLRSSMMASGTTRSGRAAAAAATAAARSAAVAPGGSSGCTNCRTTSRL